MDIKEKELRDYIQNVITNETGDVGNVSKLIKALRIDYIDRIDEESLSNVSRAKREISNGIMEDLAKLQLVDYPTHFKSAEFSNVLFDADTDDYRMSAIDYDYVSHLIKEKEQKYLGLLSSEEVCDLVYYKLDEYGDQQDVDYSECKLEVYYDRENPNYNVHKYDQSIVGNHIVINKEKSFNEEQLKRLFEKFFNENPLFHKRKINDEVVEKCVNNVLNAKDKEDALKESVEQYHLFRSVSDVNDVSFRVENNSSKPKIK